MTSVWELGSNIDMVRAMDINLCIALKHAALFLRCAMFAIDCLSFSPSIFPPEILYIDYKVLFIWRPVQKLLNWCKARLGPTARYYAQQHVHNQSTQKAVAGGLLFLWRHLVAQL